MKINLISLSRNGHNAVTHWLVSNLTCPSKLTYILNDKSKTLVHKEDYGYEVEFVVWENVDLKDVDDADVSLICLRDPFNAYASLLEFFKVTRVLGGHGVVSPREVEVWTSPIVLDKWQVLLDCAVDERTQYRFINYNYWFSDVDYRRNLIWFLREIDEVPIKFSDKVLNDLPPSNFGSGSSFDGRDFRGKAQDMNVLKRYEKYLNNKKFMNAFKGRPLIVESAEKEFSISLPTPKKPHQTFFDFL